MSSVWLPADPLLLCAIQLYNLLMKFIIRVPALVAVATLLTTSLSAQTTIALYRGGEADGGAANGVALGSSLVDSSASGNTAYKDSGTGTFTSSTGVSGSTLAYNFGDSAYYYASEVGFSPTNSFGMELWFQVPTLTGGSQVLLYDGNTASNGIGIYLSNNSLQLLRGSIALDSIATVTDTAWHYVAFAYDGGTGKVNAYYDGTQVISDYAVSFNLPIGYLTMGNSSGGTDSFSGALDEVRIFTFDNGTFSTSMLNMPAASSVPEPATYAALFGLIALGLAAYRKRHRT